MRRDEVKNGAPKRRKKCAECGASFRTRRADARFCSGACRQRTHRLRSNDVHGLLQQVDATRRQYWKLVDQLRATLGWPKSKVLSDLLAQFVDGQGRIYLRGQLIGQGQLTRPGWTCWGLEAAGPPFCPPGDYYEKGILRAARRNGSVTHGPLGANKRNTAVTESRIKMPQKIEELWTRDNPCLSAQVCEPESTGENKCRNPDTRGGSNI